MADEITLGAIQGSDEDLKLPYPTRSQHLYVVGVAGAGKSNLLEQIVYSDLLTGKGTAFLDPHGDSVEKLLRVCPPDRIDDVIYWDPAEVSHPFGLNPFFCEDTNDIRDVASRAETFVDALSSLYEFAEGFKNAPRMSVILQHLATTFVLNQGACLTEAVEFLSNDLYREKFYPALEGDRYRNVLAFWQNLDRRSDSQQRLIVESSISRLERLTSNPLISGIFGQPRNTIDFTELMNEGKVLFVRLSASEMGPDNAAFIGSYIVWEIFQAAMRRGENRRPFYLTADEFQRFMTRAFSRIIEESRKFGLSVTVAHQNLSQLDTRLRASVRDVANKVVFRLNPLDADFMAREFKVSVPEPVVDRRVYAANPYTHLKTHAHPDQKINLIRGEVDEHMTKLRDFVTSEFEGKANTFLINKYYNKYDINKYKFDRIEVTVTDRTRVSGLVKDMDGAIDSIVYEYETGVTEEINYDRLLTPYSQVMQVIWFDPWMAQTGKGTIKEISWKVREVYDEFYAKENRKDSVSIVMSRNMPFRIADSSDPYMTDEEAVWRAAVKMLNVLEAVLRLCEKVKDDPVYVIDQTKEIERPRTYADVIAERANELTTLQNYIARVRYVDGAQLKEELITTRRFEAQESAQGRARIVSRVKDFTTERHLVEQGITQRLKRPVSGTMKKYVPLRNQRDEEAPRLFEDDDEPGFEER